MTPPTTKPLRLPPGRNATENRMTREQLQGHTTSTAWLAAVPWAELDEARDDHGRLVGQLADRLADHHRIGREFADEDRQHQAALIDAARAGTPTPADGRTPEAERQAQQADAADQLWATAIALGETAARAIGTVREHEDLWLGRLRAEAQEAAEREQEALRILRDARADRVRLGLRARWVMETADDAGQGRQPWPDDARPVPTTADPAHLPLERHWTDARPWNATAVVA